MGGVRFPGETTLPYPVAYVPHIFRYMERRLTVWAGRPTLVRCKDAHGEKQMTNTYTIRRSALKGDLKQWIVCTPEGYARGPSYSTEKQALTALRQRVRQEAQDEAEQAAFRARIGWKPPCERN